MGKGPRDEEGRSCERILLTGEVRGLKGALVLGLSRLLGVDAVVSLPSSTVGGLWLCLVLLGLPSGLGWVAMVLKTLSRRMSAGVRLFVPELSLRRGPGVGQNGSIVTPGAVMAL